MIGGAVDLDDEPERTIHEVDTPDPGVTSEVDLAIERRLPGLFEKRAETLLETGRRDATHGEPFEDLAHEDDAVATVLGQLVEHLVKAGQNRG